MKLIQCSGLPWIYGQLGGGSSASRSAKFGVVVFKTSLHKWGQSVIDPCHTVTPPLPINHTSMLHHYTSEVCPRYLCSMLYVKLMWCSGLPWIYGWLKGVGLVCPWNFFGVVVLHGSMVNWRRGCQSVMEIIQCNGLPEIHAWLTRGVNLLWIYVHCAIYGTYLV